jgi:predicted ATPase
MRAFLLEVVTSTGARKGGRTYWTEKAARRDAERLVRTGKAAHVRVLPVNVSDRPCADIPTESEVRNDA